MPSKEVLIDTHVFLWILSESKRLKSLTWLKDFSPYCVSPISILEIKFLEECGRLKIDLEKIIEGIRFDERFKIDDVSLEKLCLQALEISWTRDPFDRFLVAHSSLRRIPFGTCDHTIQKNYPRAVF